MLNNSFKKKCSALLAALLMVSMLLPVISYAATTVGFYYDAETGTLSGGVYTADPNSVSVERIDQSGAAVVLTGGEIYGTSYEYDDNNNLYNWFRYPNELLTAAPAQIRVTQGEKIILLEANEYGYYGYNDPTVNLEHYRMQGKEHFSQLQGDTFLKKGQKLFTFYPEKDGGNALMVQLPKSQASGKAGTFDPAVTVGSDFTLSDTTVTNSVYASAVHLNPWFIDASYITYDTFVVEFEEPLLKGHKYELALSDTSGGNEIKLPSAATDYESDIRYGNYETYVYPGGAVRISFDGQSVALFKNISLISKVDEGGSGGGGGIGGGEVIVTPEPVDEGVQTIDASSLTSAKDGIVSINLAADKDKALLPIDAAKLLGVNKLQLNYNNAKIEIPTTILSELKGLLTAEQLEGAYISFGFNKVTGTTASDLLNKVKAENHSGIKTAGEVYDFTLSVVSKDGTVTSYNKFVEPITLRLKIEDNTNENLAGVYYIANDGKLEYVGGELVGKELVAEIHHFSKYAVLEYNKSFPDVAANHWAGDIIKIMAAKHIVQGTNTGAFAPEADVTRAEFASMLVKALGLTASGASGYADVSADAWYAEAVAAASQAGIVQGKGNSTFAPNAKITREEMSALLVRASEWKSGETLQADSIANFADRGEAAAWALPYIDAAYKAGFIQGRTNNQFAPKAQLTRAESAKAIYSILVDK